MSLYDRDYSRGSSGGGWGGGSFSSGAARVLSFFNWTFPIGTYFDIRVRVHILFVLLVAFRVWPDAGLLEMGVGAGEQMLWALRWIALLFVSVLLHEFGHCFGCRSVGGEANDILMWPLGGLAYCLPPRRPWPEFVTVACGPLVNVALAGVSYLVLLAWLGAESLPVSLNPFGMWREEVFFRYPEAGVVRLLADLFVVNYALMLFNLLLIFYPFDGGRLVQIALWTRMGYLRSMSVACALGMGGAVIVAIVGLTQGSFMLVLIAAFGFITCYQQKSFLKQAGDEESAYAGTHGGAYGGGYAAESDAPEARPGYLARRRARRAAQQVERERARRKAFDEEVDRILRKVHDHGLASLSEKEKSVLRQDTDRQRSRG